MPQQFGTPERMLNDDGSVDELLEDDMDDLELVEDIDSDEEDDLVEIDETDDAVAVSTVHTGFVLSVSMSSDGDGFCLSGGEDDTASLWKRSNAEEVLKLTAHKDSVEHTGFSNDGKYFFAADLGGTVLVYKTHDLSKSWTLECSDVEWAKWHPSAAVLFCGTVDGDIYMWKIPAGDLKIYQGHGSKTTCGVILPNGKQLFVGYDDGSTKLWDLKTSTVAFHTKEISNPINDVGVNKTGTLVGAASLGSLAHIYSVASGKVCAAFDAGFPLDEDDETLEASVESIAFSPEQQQVATGSLSGVLAVWDLSNQRLRHRCEHQSGITRIHWPESHPFEIITACLDGAVRLWDSRSGQQLRIWQGHNGGILSLAVNRLGDTIATASEDGTCRIFKR